MAYGTIRRISEDAPGLFSGTLENLEKAGEILTFTKQIGLEDVNRIDVVDYTAIGGSVADNLVPNHKINQKNLVTASKEVTEALAILSLAVARDKNDLNLIIRKF